MKARSFAGVALGLLLAACGAGQGEAYQKAFAAGQRAYHAGRYAEAARAFEAAAMAAERVKDRDEALFLEARMQERGGSPEKARATLSRLAQSTPDGPRHARAAFELGEIEIEHGDEARGFAMLFEAVKKYPGHGLAYRSFVRILEHERERGGDTAVLAFFGGPARALRGTEMDQAYDYQRGLALERTGRLAEARDALVSTARAHPYPFGALTDDAFFRAAQIEEQLGRPEAAIALLREMLATRETAEFSGSYQRPRYAPGQMRIAEITRDKLRDHAAARREFHKLYTEHPTSVLRDDALWAEARLAREDGDLGEACRLVALLGREFPDSRYVACGPLLCEKAKVPAGLRPCAGYIERQLGGEAGQGEQRAKKKAP